MADGACHTPFASPFPSTCIIHWADPQGEIEEGWETLAQIRKEGKIRYMGVSNFNVEIVADTATSAR